jgi:hypothetical protein
VIKTECTVTVYELDGADTLPLEAPAIKVRSVRPYSERVCIEIGGHRYVVLRRDMEAALAATAHEGAR